MRFTFFSWALNQLKPDERFRRDDYMEFFKGDIKERTARTDLQKLVDGAG